jgi:hypothetical protein
MMTDVHPAAQYAAIPVRQRRSTWLLAGVALCALVAGAAAAVVIYALVDDESAPAPSTVVVPVHRTTPLEVAGALAMDRYKNEARTAVAIGEQSVASPAVGAGTAAKDEAAVADAVAGAGTRTDTDAPTSSLAGATGASNQALEAKADAEAHAEAVRLYGNFPH